MTVVTNARTCDQPGCDRQHLARGYCRMHYLRVYQYGSVELRRAKPEGCLVEECDNAHNSRGYCKKHYTRLIRNGTVDFVGQKRTETPNYRRAHKWVREERGLAADHQCVDCGEKAREWSYDHTDPDEKKSPEGWVYSTDPSNYSPRCKSCHIALDRSIIK